MKEKSISEKIIFQGKMITVKDIIVDMGEGNTSGREIVEHPGAVAILAFDDNNNLILVRQFRKAVECELWEIPAGKIEQGENILECAEREFKEETGYLAKEWIYYGEIFTSPGFANEKICLFEARDLLSGEQMQDEDEDIALESFSEENIKEMVLGGILKDAKTLAALLFYYYRK